MTFETIWTKETIKKGFDRFISENGRLPTAPEIDHTAYLPTARQIQRSFGGLKTLRKELGYEDHDFGSGSFRSEQANRTNKRGRVSEKELEEFLVSKFGEVYVHGEKRYGKGSNRADFIVFTPDGNFGIDVFFTDTLRDFQKNINLKIEKYLDYPKDVHLYFVCANTAISEDDIQYTTAHMSKLKLLPQLKVLGLEGLNSELESMRRYEDPVNFKPLLVVTTEPDQVL